MARLSTPLQLEHLQSTFSDLNPGTGVDVIDWRAIVDPTLTMGENVDAFEEAYPQFNWFRPETMGPDQYAEMVIQGLAVEAEPYGYELIRARKLESLQKRPGKLERKLEKVTIALEKCQGLRPARKPRPKVTCRESEKIQVCFMRCP